MPRKVKLIVFALFVFVLISFENTLAATYLVDPNGSKDFTSIQQAIDSVSYGDTILVAAGNYLENISLKNGVAFIGAGAQTTTIDGNSLGTTVETNGCDPNTLILGFTITGGTGSTVNLWGFDYQCGGGMYNHNSSVQVEDCAFIANTAADYGTAIFNYNGGSVGVAGCTFANNSGASSGGGGICTLESSAKISGCNFTNNSSGYGGAGIANWYSNVVTVTGCNFTENDTNGYGGALFSFDADVTVTNCTFTDNASSYYGGAMYNGADVTVKSCTFTGNSAMKGGAVYNNSKTVFARCLFTANSAEDNGTAGIYTGGAMYNAGQNDITNCVLTGNTAVHDGGAMFNASDNTIVANSAIVGNSSTQGGGIHNYSGSIRIVNCSLVGNLASYEGGSIYNTNGSSPEIFNSVLWYSTAQNTGNMSWDPGNEVFNYPSSPANEPVFINSNIAGSNTGGTGWNEDIGIDGGGNIDADPMFTDPDGPDDIFETDDNNLRLLSGSPCIDSGDNQLAPMDVSDLDNDGALAEAAPLDLDDNRRFLDDKDTADKGNSFLPNIGVIDMGPYEYPGIEHIKGDIDEDGDVDFEDFAELANNWLKGTD